MDLSRDSLIATAEKALLSPYGLGLKTGSQNAAKKLRWRLYALKKILEKNGEENPFTLLEFRIDDCTLQLLPLKETETEVIALSKVHVSNPLLKEFRLLLTKSDWPKAEIDAQVGKWLESAFDVQDVKREIQEWKNLAKKASGFLYKGIIVPCRVYPDDGKMMVEHQTLFDLGLAPYMADTKPGDKIGLQDVFEFLLRDGMSKEEAKGAIESILLCAKKVAPFAYKFVNFNI